MLISLSDKPDIHWMWLIKIFIFATIILAYINTFVRSDFVNIIVPTMILVIFYTTLNKNVHFYLNVFLIAIASALGYDLLWFLFSSGTYSSGSTLEGGNQNSLRFLVFITSFSSFIVKILLGISLWIQKLKYEREGGAKTGNNGNKTTQQLNSSDGAELV